jgi:ABC-type multidrug transport system fused ATPase/permease subunit
MLFFTLFRSILNIIQITIFREFISRFNRKQQTNGGFYKNFSHWNVGITYLTLRVIEVFTMRKCCEYQTFLGFKNGTELTCIIYEKLLKVSPASLKEKSKSGEVINYIQVDAHRLTFLMLSSPDLLTMPLQIIVFSYMLFKFFGWNFIFGLITLIFFLYLNFKLQTKMKKLMVNQMKVKDKRMKIITETFNSIKLLKLYS